jgi:RNA polymerase sigma-70 factor (ECF subfamily)
MRDASNGSAWEKFYHLYGGPITAYAGKLGLDDASAQDVLQETMVALMRILPRFEYNPERGKFRNFLLTIVHRKTLSARGRRIRRGEVSLDAPAGDEDEGRSLLDDLADNRTVHPSAAIQHDWQEALLQDATKRVLADPTVEPKTAAVFAAYVVEDRPAAEVAARFHITENNVYQIRNRLLSKIKAEVALLRKTLEP